jgi:hypothetical protein
MNHNVIVNDECYGGLNPVLFGYEDCAKNHFFGPAIRKYYLLHFVVSGFGKFEIGGKSYSVGPGEIFVIPPDEETYYEADSEHPWHYIWIGFTGDPPCDLNVSVLHKPELGDIFTDALKCKGMNRGKSAYSAGILWRIISCLLE